MEKSRKIKIEKLLCTLIILCPILDMLSFIFRNTFKTNISPSTFLRPVISIIVITHIIVKDKNRWKIIGVGTIYVIYALIHILLFNQIRTGCSYGNIAHETQYLINYSFMILNLYVYIYAFKKENIELVRKSIFIAISIYTISIYISIITGTSSYTYPVEQMGIKGWFESGNSLSAILVLSMFIILPMIKNTENIKKRIIYSIVTLLVGIFLMTQIGTRVGLFGFILVLALYIVLEIIFSLLKNKKVNKKIILISLGIIAIIAVIILILGSNTFIRRKHIEEESKNNYDQTRRRSSTLNRRCFKYTQSNCRRNFRRKIFKPSRKEVFSRVI